MVRFALIPIGNRSDVIPQMHKAEAILPAKCLDGNFYVLPEANGIHDVEPVKPMLWVIHRTVIIFFSKR